MATVKKMKKAQEGAGVPKGKVQGEMTGKMYDKKAFMARKDSASADLQKAIGPKKVAPKKKMKSGGSLKPVAADQKGLAKLPTPVRNKMGYQKVGGKTKKAMSGGKCKYGCK